MCYVTHGHEIKTYDTEAEALERIDYEMGGLTSRKIFDETKNGIRVIVYQWWTLRTDVFILCDKPDMRQSV